MAQHFPIAFALLIRAPLAANAHGGRDRNVQLVSEHFEERRVCREAFREVVHVELPSAPASQGEPPARCAALVRCAVVAGAAEATLELTVVVRVFVLPLLAVRHGGAPPTGLLPLAVVRFLVQVAVVRIAFVELRAKGRILALRRAVLVRAPAALSLAGEEDRSCRRHPLLPHAPLSDRVRVADSDGPLRSLRRLLRPAATPRPIVRAALHRSLRTNEHARERKSEREERETRAREREREEGERVCACVRHCA